MMDLETKCAKAVEELETLQLKNELLENEKMTQMKQITDYRLKNCVQMNRMEELKLGFEASKKTYELTVEELEIRICSLQKSNF